jgi:hypothetical protein
MHKRQVFKRMSYAPFCKSVITRDHSHSQHSYKIIKKSSVHRNCFKSAEKPAPKLDQFAAQMEGGLLNLKAAWLNESLMNCRQTVHCTDCITSRSPDSGGSAIHHCRWTNLH